MEGGRQLKIPTLSPIQACYFLSKKKTAPADLELLLAE